MDKQTKSIYQRLKAFAEENKCDSVMLIDGTVKQYMGERFLAVAIYKVAEKKTLCFITTILKTEWF